MKPFRSAMGLLLLVGASAAAGYGLSGRSTRALAAAVPAAQQSPTASFPKDVYPETGNRLPPIKRDDLDDAGKKLFDSRGPSADFFGPGAIRLYSVPVAEHMGAVNEYLRYKSGLDPRLVQLAILVTARECQSEYIWTAHEPQGLKAGLQPEAIDVVRFRKSPQGLDEKAAVIIEFAREAVGKHHVTPDVAARAAKLFSKQELVNYAALMGDYAATATLLNAFDQHVRPSDKPLLPLP